MANKRFSMNLEKVKKVLKFLAIMVMVEVIIEIALMAVASIGLYIVQIKKHGIDKANESMKRFYGTILRFWKACFQKGFHWRDINASKYTAAMKTAYKDMYKAAYKMDYGTDINDEIADAVADAMM